LGINFLGQAAIITPAEILHMSSSGNNWICFRRSHPQLAV